MAVKINKFILLFFSTCYLNAAHYNYIGAHPIGDLGLNYCSDFSNAEYLLPNEWEPYSFMNELPNSEGSYMSVGSIFRALINFTKKFNRILL